MRTLQALHAGLRGAEGKALVAGLIPGAACAALHERAVRVCPKKPRGRYR